MLPSHPYALEHQQMVQQQIADRGLTNPKLLQAFLNVPRHLFVPTPLLSQAYADHPLPIGHNQTISQPYIVAFMTNAILPPPSLPHPTKALDVGTGSGYQAAILSQLFDEVYSIEIVPELAHQAKSRLQKLGYHNIHVCSQDAFQGLPHLAPFHAIIVAAASPKAPSHLLQQLAIGASLIIPLDSPNGQELVQITRTAHNHWTQKSLLNVRFVPLTGQAQENP